MTKRRKTKRTGPKRKPSKAFAAWIKAGSETDKQYESGHIPNAKKGLHRIKRRKDPAFYARLVENAQAHGAVLSDATKKRYNKAKMGKKDF
jgi:hypothetical protein